MMISKDILKAILLRAGLQQEVEAGRIPMSDLDRAVSNILFVKFATGLFDAAVEVSRHDIAGIWVAFFQECQR